MKRSSNIPPRYPWHTRQDEAARMRFILEGRCPKCREVHPTELGEEVQLVRHGVRRSLREFPEAYERLGHPVDRIGWPESE